VQAGATIGEGTRLVSHVVVLSGATVGREGSLHAGAVIGDLPQDLAFGGGETFVRVGDRCRLREGVTIHRGTVDGSTTVVGDDCMLMANSHVAHNCRLGDRVMMANGVLLAGHVEVGERVFLGGGTTVHQFTRIGRLAMVSGMSAVKRDVPPFCMTRELSSGVMGLNTVGLRRAGIGSEDRMALKRAFRILYRSGLALSRALERIEAEVDNLLAAELVEFIAGSKRGIAGYVGGRARDRDADD
jgi:UDP-N-acetylglucosamine acyltransferase